MALQSNLVKSSCSSWFEVGANGPAGGDNNLGLFLGKPQEPSTNVRCYGSADVRAIVNSCQSIMDRMYFSNNKMTFGKQGDVGVEVALPYTWNSSEQLVVRP